jgi:hypothetical protein
MVLFQLVCFQLGQLVFGSILFVFGLFIWFSDQFSLFLDQVGVLGPVKFVDSVCDKLFVIGRLCYSLKALLHGCGTLICSKLGLYDNLQLERE